MQQIIVEMSDTKFSDVYEYPCFPNDEHAKKANLLALPLKEDEETGYYFTEYADEFIHYVQHADHDGIIFDIAMRDDEYQIVTQHFELVDLGRFIIKEGLITILLNLISSFIYDRFMNPITKEPDVEFKFEVISQGDDGKAVDVSYHGPVSGLESICDVISKTVD